MSKQQPKATVSRRFHTYYVAHPCMYERYST